MKVRSLGDSASPARGGTNPTSAVRSEAVPGSLYRVADVDRPTMCVRKTSAHAPIPIERVAGAHRVTSVTIADWTLEAGAECSTCAKSMPPTRSATSTSPSCDA